MCLVALNSYMVMFSRRFDYSHLLTRKLILTLCDLSVIMYNVATTWLNFFRTTNHIT